MSKLSGCGFLNLDKIKLLLVNTEQQPICNCAIDISPGQIQQTVPWLTLSLGEINPTHISLGPSVCHTFFFKFPYPNCLYKRPHLTLTILSTLRQLLYGPF